MTNYILLAVSLFAVTAGNILRKFYSAKTQNTLINAFVFSAIGSIVCAIVLAVWGGISAPSAFTVWFAAIFGAVTVIYNIIILAAYEAGPMSYTTVIVSFSTIATALSGFLFFDESISPTQIIGIVLMLASFSLAVDKSAGEKKASLRWLALCFVAFLCCGAVGIMQKVHQSSAFKDELNEFLFIAFAISFILSVITIAVLRARSASSSSAISCERGKLIAILLITAINGITVAVNNKLNLFLSGAMESAIFFPVMNGGTLMLTTLGALLIFKERLSKRQWIGIAIGMVSVILLCNPF